MLILLPIIAFVFIFLALLGFEYTTGTQRVSARGVFLQTSALLGAYTVLFSELLSLFSALNTLWVSVSWGIALAVSVYLGWRKGWVAKGVTVLRSKWQKPDLFDWVAGTTLAIILSLLFVVAVKSPPNNNDSLLYHMSRVMHWAQNGSLHHYATAFVPQLVQPIWAELAILNTRLLWGNDLLSSLVQLASMAGTLIGISAIARFLGAGRKGQWAAIAFAASLPIGVLEATSTQNDYVTTFWLICLLYFVLRSTRPGANLLDILFIGLTFGLGLLTKGTFYPYAIAPMIYLIINQFRQHKAGRVLFHGLIIAVMAILLNMGYWTRNTITFGTPLGSKNFVSTFTAKGFGPGTIVGSVLRNVSLNLATPEENVNAAIIARVNSFLRILDPTMDHFDIVWAWNHEDIAGNPLHVLLIFACMIGLILLRKKISNKLVWPYVLVITGMYIFFSAIVKFDLFGIRYQLPFFAAIAPVFGLSVELTGPRRLAPILTILLLLSAFPWVLFNRTRPLIAMRPSNDPFTIPCYAGCTTGSILNELPESTLFAVWSDRKDSYIDSMKLVKSLACKDIGLKLDSSDLEYAYWWLLDAPQSGRRLESIETIPELERYLDSGFKPCAIICTTCGKDQNTLNGVDLISEFQRIKIYGNAK
jgi:hypothetical protein